MSNIFPRLVCIPTAIWVTQSGKTASHFKLILFFHLVQGLEIESLCIKLLCYFFTDWQSLSKMFKHRFVMNKTVTSSERSDIKYWYCIWMPFPTYEGRDHSGCEYSHEETSECSLFVMFWQYDFWVAIFTTYSHKCWCYSLIHNESCPYLTSSFLFCRQGTVPCSFSAARFPPTLRYSHLANSLTTVFSDPDIYSFLIFQVPSLMSIYFIPNVLSRGLSPM